MILDENKSICEKYSLFKKMTVIRDRFYLFNVSSHTSFNYYNYYHFIIHSMVPNSCRLVNAGKAKDAVCISGV